MRLAVLQCMQRLGPGYRGVLSSSGMEGATHTHTHKHTSIQKNVADTHAGCKSTTTSLLPLNELMSLACLDCMMVNRIFFPPFSLPLCITGIENLYERALYIRKILLTVPRSVLIVMRYLFAFLNQ